MQVEIIAVGLSHKTSPIEVRERVAILDHELEDFLGQFAQTHTLLETVVLSTCNRTEIYAIVSSAHSGQDYIETLIARRAGQTKSSMVDYMYTYTGQAAVEHLMRVACGLDSVVIGETQILGQVRNAFLVAQDVQSTGVLLNQLFRRVIQVGKRAQTETEIGQRAVSVSYAAVQLAKKIYGNLANRSVLVLGAGKMSRLTIQHLVSNRPNRVYVANRTMERAVQLAKEYGAAAVSWDEFPDLLATVDLVISSTSSAEPIITRAMVERAQKLRHKSAPFTFIDIALPRDFDAHIAEVRNVFLYDIDDLEGVVEANLQERERQALVVKRMVAEATHSFADWLAEQEVVPLVMAVRDKGVRIQQSVMESLERKLPNLTEHDRKVLQKHTMSIVNQLLRDPIQNMKELAIASGGGKNVQVFAELFGVSASDMAASTCSVKVSEADFGEADIRFVDMVRQWSEGLLRDLHRGSVQQSLAPFSDNP